MYVWDLHQPVFFALDVSCIWDTLRGGALVGAALCPAGRGCAKVFHKHRRQHRSVRLCCHSQGLNPFSFLHCCFVSRASGTVYTAIDIATGQEVSANSAGVQCCPLWCRLRGACGISTAKAVPPKHGPASAREIRLLRLFLLSADGLVSAGRMHHVLCSALQCRLCAPAAEHSAFQHPLHWGAD